MSTRHSALLGRAKSVDEATQGRICNATTELRSNRVHPTQSTMRPLPNWQTRPSADPGRGGGNEVSVGKMRNTPRPATRAQATPVERRARVQLMPDVRLFDHCLGLIDHIAALISDKPAPRPPSPTVQQQQAHTSKGSPICFEWAPWAPYSVGVARLLRNLRQSRAAKI